MPLDRRSEAIAKLLETALEERFDAPVIELLQAVPIPLAVVEAADLRALAVNELMARVLQRGDAAGLTISSLVPPAHPLSDPRPFRSVAATSQPFAATVVIDGQTWKWFIRPLKGPGRSVEHFLTGLVASPVERVDLDVAHLREMNAAKTEFLSMAAQELRTPLSVILGYGSLLAHGWLSPEHQKLADRDRRQPPPRRDGDRPLPRAGGRPRAQRPGDGGQPSRGGKRVRARIA